MTSRPRYRLPLRALSVALLAALPAAAQSGRTPPEPGGTPTAGTQPETIELAATPFELHGIGMRFRLPVGATATARRLGNETHAVVVGPGSAYQITVSSRSSSNTDLTAEAAAEAVLLNLKQAYGITDGDAERPSQSAVATYARVLRGVEPVPFSTGAAYRFLLLQPSTRSEPESVRGVAVIDLGQGRMLVWDATTPKSTFDSFAASLDAMLGTVEFDDAQSRYASRGIAIVAGQKLLEQLRPEDMRSIVESHGERWARLYTPGPNGTDEEAGYRRVRASLGTRADMTEGGRARGEDDEKPGYLVRIDARTLGEQAVGGRTVYDSRGTYWVSEDLESEAWTIVVAIKQNGRTTTYTSTGAREGFEEIMVSTQSPTGTSEATQLQINREGYLPTPLTLLLPAMLAQAGTSGDFAFYAYRSDTAAVSYRTDSLRESETGEGWVLRSVTAPGAPQLVRFLDPAGSVVREQLPDGKLWEPIELRELAALWRRKGLPLK